MPELLIERLEKTLTLSRVKSENTFEVGPPSRCTKGDASHSGLSCKYTPTGKAREGEPSTSASRGQRLELDTNVWFRRERLFGAGGLSACSSSRKPPPNGGDGPWRGPGDDGAQEVEEEDKEAGGRFILGSL